RPHAVHTGGRGRTLVGAGGRGAGEPRTGARVPGGHMGAGRVRRADRPAALAPGGALVSARRAGHGRIIDVSLTIGPDLLIWPGNHPAFPEVYACLTPEAARWVVERGIRLIGVDFLSVEAKGAEGHPVHHILLENGVVIVEGLDLSQAEPGTYTVACLPLKLKDGDGGPARAILIAT